jgi:hypothetical protein
MHSSPWKSRSCIKVHKLYLSCNNIRCKGIQGKREKRVLSFGFQRCSERVLKLRWFRDVSSENSVEIDTIDFPTANYHRAGSCNDGTINVFLKKNSKPPASILGEWAWCHQAHASIFYIFYSFFFYCLFSYIKIFLIIIDFFRAT